MIIYKTSDILKRAAQLADLENSDFISWNEKINLLNESYRKLYQIVINNNDKYYLKKVKVSDLVRGVDSSANEAHYFLPADFYQLCAIQTTENQSPLLRKSLAEPVQARRYEIINEEVVIYGNADSEPLDLLYYPIPLTLSTSAPDRKLESVSDTILDCNGNGFLCINSDGDVYVHNVAKGIDTEPVTMGLNEDDILFGVLGRKYAVVVMDDDSVYFIDLIGNSYADISAGGFKVAKKDNEIYLFKKQDDDTFTVYKESAYSSDTFRRVYADKLVITLPSGYLFSAPDVWTFTDNLSYIYIPYQQTDDVMRLWECSSTEAKKSIEVSDWKKNTIINGDLYSINYDICINGAKLVSDADFYALIGFNKADGSTGYGVSVLNDDGDLVVKSVFMDTELNFPNNFYFNYIAYMLAVAYKTKQNADSQGLMAQADAEELAFYDTLNRDVSNTTRITNVYRGGIW